MHDFFGNKTTNPNSTLESLQAGGPPVRGLRTNRPTGYRPRKWIDKSGTRTLTVDKGLFYYRLASKDPNVDVQPHPDGPKVVTVQGSNVEWRYANGTWSTYPPAQCTNGKLVVRIKFPTASLKTRTGSRCSTAPTTARTWSTPSRRATVGGRSARASTQPFYRSSK
jgi:hypothetical protein